MSPKKEAHNSEIDKLQKENAKLRESIEDQTLLTENFLAYSDIRESINKFMVNLSENDTFIDILTDYFIIGELKLKLKNIRLTIIEKDLNLIIRQDDFRHRREIFEIHYEHSGTVKEVIDTAIVTYRPKEFKDTDDKVHKVINYYNFNLGYLEFVSDAYGKEHESADAMIGDHYLVENIDYYIETLGRILNVLYTMAIRNRDHLTKVYRREASDAIINSCFRSLKIKEIGSFCICWYDIDHFKWINDYGGHLFGDRVLERKGIRSLESCRGNDYVVRIGGDEFFVMLLFEPEVDAAEQYKEIVQDYFSKLRKPYTVPIFFGKDDSGFEFIRGIISWKYDKEVRKNLGMIVKDWLSDNLGARTIFKRVDETDARIINEITFLLKQANRFSLKKLTNIMLLDYLKSIMQEFGIIIEKHNFSKYLRVVSEILFSLLRGENIGDLKNCMNQTFKQKRWPFQEIDMQIRFSAGAQLITDVEMFRIKESSKVMKWDIEKLKDNLDKNMYAAKRQGRNRIVFADEQLPV
ncbi:diguanylate cyclase [Spirochaetota bacterium]